MRGERFRVGWRVSAFTDNAIRGEGFEDWG